VISTDRKDSGRRRVIFSVPEYAETNYERILKGGPRITDVRCNTQVNVKVVYSSQ